MTPGTKVRTLTEISETATVVKPLPHNLPLPSPDWVIIRYDDGGGKMCVHRSCLALSNAA